MLQAGRSLAGESSVSSQERRGDSDEQMHVFVARMGPRCPGQLAGAGTGNPCAAASPTTHLSGLLGPPQLALPQERRLQGPASEFKHSLEC